VLSAMLCGAMQMRRHWVTAMVRSWKVSAPRSGRGTNAVTVGARLNTSCRAPEADARGCSSRLTVEAGLLLQQVAGGWLGGFLPRQMNTFVPAVLRRMAGLDAPDVDAKA
jgi:hypothetical protein